VSRLVAGGAALVAALVMLTGCAEEVGGISGTCTQPETLNDGFFADRSIFFRVSTQKHPTDPRTTWVCFRVKVQGQTDTAGRIDVNPTAGTTGSEVTADTDSRSCAIGSGNLVPGPHPVQEGAVLDTPFYLDAYAGGDPLLTDDGVALCVEVGSIKQRVVVPLPEVQLPTVTARTDPAPPAPQDTTPPPAGKPSSSCYEGRYGTPSELINAHLGSRDLYLFTARPNETELHVCARLSGQQSGGGRLSVNAAPGQIVRVDQSPDVSPCTQNVVTLSNPRMSIALTPTGQSPPSVCVSGTRYTVVTGPIPPVVAWTPDT
jgi:hypothetical protein